MSQDVVASYLSLLMMFAVFFLVGIMVGTVRAEFKWQRRLDTEQDKRLLLLERIRDLEDQLSRIREAVLSGDKHDEDIA